MAKEPLPDRAYLVRCWQENGALPAAQRWRFSVEEVTQEGQRWGFKDLDALVAFLRAELEHDHPELLTDES